VPNSGKTVVEFEQGLRRELAKIVTEGVSDDELKRVKAQVVAAQVFQRDSMFFQARQIGSLEVAGYSHLTIDAMIRKLQQVTAAQVQAVAKKYLVDDSLTVAVLDPQPLDGRKPAAGPAGARHGQ
jgi:zinc protease